MDTAEYERESSKMDEYIKALQSVDLPDIAETIDIDRLREDALPLIIADARFIDWLRSTR